LVEQKRFFGGPLKIVEVAFFFISVGDRGRDDHC
jgi:hypothetical protein